MRNLPPPKPATTGPAVCNECGYEYRVVMWDLMRPCPECGHDPEDDEPTEK